MRVQAILAPTRPIALVTVRPPQVTLVSRAVATIRLTVALVARARLAAIIPAHRLCLLPMRPRGSLTRNATTMTRRRRMMRLLPLKLTEYRLAGLWLTLSVLFLTLRLA